MTTGERGAGNGRIAAVVATPPGFNPGMAACELALSRFAERQGFAERLCAFRLLSLDERSPELPEGERKRLAALGALPLAYRSAKDHLDELLAADVILFWGDFLHMAQYQRALRRLLETLMPAVSAADPDLVARVLLLKGAPPAVFRKVVSFGTTLLFNTIADEEGTEYGRDLRTFLSLARRVWTRDVQSAARVAFFRGDYAQGFWGCDAAQLFRRDDLAAITGSEIAPREPGDGSVGVFFGRTPRFREPMLAVAEAVAARRGGTVRSLPWGSTSAFPKADPAGLSPGASPAPDLLGLLRAVAESSAVVTDTYHLAVIAWTFGVPAVALSAPVDPSEPSVDSGAAFNWRDKRETFFSQYDALDFLVRAEEAAEPERLARRVERILERLESEGHVRAVAGRMRAHSRWCEEACAKAIREISAGGDGR